MNALVPVFLAILLAETGGKMQAMAHGMALAGLSLGRVLAMVLVIALIVFGVSAAAGVLMAGLMPPDGRRLFFALSLLFAGVPMLWQQASHAVPDRANWSAVPRLAIQMATDAGPFIVLAAAAYTASPALAASAAVAGVLVQGLVPALLGTDWPGAFPLRLARLGAAVLLILGGLWSVINALRIV
jgi:hypothetical protein